MRRGAGCVRACCAWRQSPVPAGTRATTRRVTPVAQWPAPPNGTAVAAAASRQLPLARAPGHPHSPPPPIAQPALVCRRFPAPDGTVYTAARPPHPLSALTDVSSPGCERGNQCRRWPCCARSSIMWEDIQSAVISFIFLSTVSLSAARPIKHRSNPLGIDWSPAPSPQDGPPLSAGALRDPAYLPAEVVGIVGSYVFVVCVVGTALLLTGRHLRREREQSCQELPVLELIQPRVQNYAGPLSPTGRTNFSYPATEKSSRTPYIFPAPQIHSPQSPGTDPNVDLRVVEADREMLQKDLEDLYAHVMEHEEAKARGVAPPEPLLTQKRGQIPGASPQRPTKKDGRPTLANIGHDESKKQKTSSRTSSIISSLRSPMSRKVKALHISSPMPTPLSSTFPSDYVSDDEPLSPRQPPPLPPVPTDQSSDDISPTRSIAELLGQTNSLQHKSSLSASSSQSDPNPLFSNPVNKSASVSKVSLSGRPQGHLPASPRPDGKSPRLAPLNQSANNSTRTLPFRAYEPASPNSPSTPQTTTKTTVLERAAPMSPGLRTPWTAGSMPYSPYQPFTPLLPVTPTLVTKEHRKMMKKREKRMPVLEMVSNADEMWDTGY